MSYDLALGRLNHDLVFRESHIGHHSIWPMEGADRVAQQVKITLLAFLGEWFLDNRFGIPYLEDILVKNPRISSVESILRSRIAAVPDVRRVEFLTLDFNRQRRELIVDFAANTELGLIRDSIVLSVALRRA